MHQQPPNPADRPYGQRPQPRAPQDWPTQTGYGQGAYPPPAYQQPPPLAYQPPVVVAPAPYPHRAVTRRPLSPLEHTFHGFMTLCTAGLWGVIWWSRVRSRRTVTTWE